MSLFSVDVNTSVFVPTNDFINIKADAIVKLQISQEPDTLNIASKNFLNKRSEHRRICKGSTGREPEGDNRPDELKGHGSEP